MRVEYYCGERPETSDSKENLNNSKTNKKRVLRNSCVLLNHKLEPRHEDGHDYCLMHLPDENKSSKFEDLFKETFDKLKDGKEKFGFHGYWFPKQSANLLESCFSSYIFNNEVSFRSAVFNSEINFSSAEFKQKVSFWDACFEDKAIFTNVEFNSETTFTHAIFENEVNFWRSRFKGETFFYKTIFNSKFCANFIDTTFSNYVIFRGELNEDGKPNGWLVDFEDSKFEKPEQTIFQSVRLHPYHFISHQPRKFVFVDVHWENSGGSEEEIKDELNKLKSKNECKQEKELTNGSKKTGNNNSSEETKNKLDEEKSNDKPNREKESTIKFPEKNTDKSVKVEHDSNESNNKNESNQENELNADTLNENSNETKKANQNSDKQKNNNETNQGESTHSSFNLERLLNVTCNQLAANAEENSRFRDASNFRRMAFELERLDRNKSNEPDLLHGLYRWTSGYGENWSRALIILLAIWIIFTFLYAIPSRQTEVLQFAPAFINSKGSDSQGTEPKSALIKKGSYEISFQSNQSVNNFFELIAEAGTYSLGVLTLQKPEPSPANWSAKLSVMIETILGPLQLALLALAIRRKFMR